MWYLCRFMPNPRYILGLLLLLGLCAQPLLAQKSSFLKQQRYVPTGPYDYDSTDAENSERMALQTAGLLTREIDPKEYIVGPNDILTVSVWTTESIHADVIVSPEGKLVFPNAGVLNVKGLSLDSVNKIVEKEARRIYHNASVDVSLKRLRQFKVYLMGAVAVPSVIAATAADHVFDILERAGGVVDTAALRGIMLFREGQSEPILVDLQRYMSFGDKEMNPTLLGGDRIIVPLRNSKNVITISGEVVEQREYPFLPGDSLSTIIKMSGGFMPSARLDSVRLIRINEEGDRLDEVIFDLTSWEENLFTTNTLPGDIALRSGDRVYVRGIPRWNERQDVVIDGEVRFPGNYALVPNKTSLTDVIAASGGFTKKASLEDAIIIRTSELLVVDKEFERLRKLPPSEMSAGELQYFKTKAREQKGVLSVSFPDLFVKGDLGNNPILQDGDSIYVPEKNLYINITGSVRNSGRIVFQPGMSYLDYIELAGGYGFRADIDETLIIKPKGDQFPAASENYSLEPGDNILVLDEPEVRFIDVFTEVLTISAQIVTVVGVVLTIVRLQ